MSLTLRQVLLRQYGSEFGALDDFDEVLRGLRELGFPESYAERPTPEQSDAIDRAIAEHVSFEYSQSEPYP